MDEARQRLRDALTEALVERDAPALAAIRSALAAIANAEAVEHSGPAKPKLGVGAGEAARRELSTEEVLEILRAEIGERTSAAAEYEKLGRREAAIRLRAEAAILERLL